MQNKLLVDIYALFKVDALDR